MDCLRGQLAAQGAINQLVLAHPVETGEGGRMICRTSGVTGTRVKAGRICMTADEWAETELKAAHLISIASSDGVVARQ